MKGNAVPGDIAAEIFGRGGGRFCAALFGMTDYCLCLGRAAKCEHESGQGETDIFPHGYLPNYHLLLSYHRDKKIKHMYRIDRPGGKLVPYNDFGTRA